MAGPITRLEVDWLVGLSWWQRLRLFFLPGRWVRSGRHEFYVKRGGQVTRQRLAR